MEESVRFLESYFSQEKLEQLVIIGVKIAMIYAMLMAIVYMERRLFRNFIERRDRRLIDKTNLVFLKNIVIYTTYCVGFLTIFNQIPGMQQLSKTLLTGAGILAAAVAFGSQQAVSNIVSGIFMVIFKPFRIGDFIELSGDNKGTVMEINLRHTKIKNADNRIIIIPNTVLNNQSIVNLAKVSPVTCAFVQVPVDFSANVNRAIDIMHEETMKHPLLIDNRTEAEIEKGVPQVIIRMIEWEKSLITLRAWAWAANSSDAFILKCDLLKAIKERFEQEKIEIPA